MHVLILAQYYPPDLGGSSTRAYNVARGLVASGVEATVVAAYPHYPHGEVPRGCMRKPYTRGYEDGVEVIRTFMLPVASKGLANRLITFMTFIFSSLTGLLLVRDVDTVWAANPDIFALIPGLVYKAVHRCPLIFNVDDLSVEDVDNLGLIERGSVSLRLARVISRFLYQRADAVTPISPGYFEGIGRLGVPRGRMHLVRSGVDLSTFKQVDSKPCELFTVAYSGSFSVAYDFSQMIRAAELLKGSNVVFLIQGRGELGPWIRKEIESRGLMNVRLFDEVLSRGQVARFLGEASALILPLKDFRAPYRGISSKLYEYQAIGKPIICCSEGQSSEYVEETGSGVVVKPGDHRALAEAVLFLRDNPGEALRLGLSGRRYVERNAGIEQIGARMKEVVNLVLNGGG